MNTWKSEIKLKKKPKLISIATDCSGIEAPLHSLNQLGIKYTHSFSCENDKKCANIIKKYHKPKHFFPDIFGRDLSIIKEPLDIYVCGFPCQSFSIAGNQNGFRDPRGTVFFECFKTIQTLEPKVFILENVKNLKSHEKGATFKMILEYLESLQKYNIYHQVVNTKDYGIPQNRPRLYIIGILKNLDNGFEFPSTIPTNPISNFMEKGLPHSTLTDTQQYILEQRMKNKDPTKNYIVNLGVSRNGGFGSAMEEMSPCLLASHRYYYSTNVKRFLTVKEWMLLQGFDDCKEEYTFKHFGNTMSVNVLSFLFASIFNKIDL